MIAPDREKLITVISQTKLKDIQAQIVQLLDEKYAHPKHGHFSDWRDVYETLPLLQASQSEFNSDTVIIGQENDISSQQRKFLKEKLKALCPWRKGPFNIFGIHIDTEWRSDLKWSRIAPHINITNKLVLDIGCGNGYYALRMQGLGAKLVIGIDPSWHYAFQFHVLQRYSSIEQKSFVLPFTLEEFPNALNTFDTIFSMGVLYHRQDPQAHLDQVYSLLQPKGLFVLETLIIKDENADILIPNDRYANMRNVWMIPSIELLKKWLINAGFVDCKTIDITATTIEEQRQTEWMTRYSLGQALNPDDSRLTIEGYPAPLRVVMIAGKSS